MFRSFDTMNMSDETPPGLPPHLLAREYQSAIAGPTGNGKARRKLMQKALALLLLPEAFASQVDDQVKASCFLLQLHQVRNL
jgi:hypothetical protein